MAGVREFRYERKFFIDQVDAPQAIGLIRAHPAMFSEIYPPRWINNIYLDYPWMENYYDNVDGMVERRKVRVRWYHVLFRQIDHPVLELKIKNGLVGTKAQYPFPAFTLDKVFSEHYFMEKARQAELPAPVKALMATQTPVLLNRYLRWYFATPGQKFRVTVDTSLTFYKLNKFSNRFMGKVVDHRDIVVEMKYQVEDDLLAQRISASLPFRMTRSSKYVQGVEGTYI